MRHPKQRKMPESEKEETKRWALLSVTLTSVQKTLNLTALRPEHRTQVTTRFSSWKGPDLKRFISLLNLN